MMSNWRFDSHEERCSVKEHKIPGYRRKNFVYQALNEKSPLLKLEVVIECPAYTRSQNQISFIVWPREGSRLKTFFCHAQSGAHIRAKDLHKLIQQAVSADRQFETIRHPKCTELTAFYKNTLDVPASALAGKLRIIQCVLGEALQEYGGLPQEISRHIASLDLQSLMPIDIVLASTSSRVRRLGSGAP